MPTEFNTQIMQAIVDVEGSMYTNRPTDRGGATKYGITQRSYPNVDIKNLTFSQAQVIYRRDFWDRYHIGDIDDPIIATKVMLAVVNMGYTNASRCVQSALKIYGLLTDIDGVMGTRTLTAINAARVAVLAELLRASFSRYYLNIVAADVSQQMFLLGWLRRAMM